MTEITLKKINNEIVIPLKVGGAIDNRPVKGAKLFSEPFANIYLCARKKSGKTVVIQKIVKDCVGKHTTVLAFCSTVNKDKNWIAIRKWCKKHSIAFEGFPSIKEHKIDFLEQFMHRVEDEAEEEMGGDDRDSDEEENDNKMGRGVPKQINFFGGKREDDYDSAGSDESSADEGDDMFGSGERKKADEQMVQKKLFDKKSKSSLVKKDSYIAPEYLLILDDISHELKLPSLVALLKKNRHYKLKVVLSSQYLNDLKPESIKQMDYVLLFKGQTNDKLEKIIRDSDLAIDFDTLKQIYDDCVKDPFGFLYINVREDEFRKNFDKQYMIRKVEE